jgi:hypothetical protein
MTIHKSVQYVRGAIDSGQFVPAFKNYAIANRMIQGSDGVVTLNASIDLDYETKVDAVRFARAVTSCALDEPIAIDLTKTGNLRIKQGAFRVIVPTAAIDFPWAEPEGERMPVAQNFLEQLRVLKPFIGIDATRPWSQGVLIHRGTMYATNNVVLVAGVVGHEWKDVENIVLPVRAVEELLRVNIPPKIMLVADNAITFMHSKTWWLKCQRIVQPWPDVCAMFEAAKASKMKRIPEALYTGLTRLAPFTSGAEPIYIIDGKLSTSRVPDDDGASLEGFEDLSNVAFMSNHFKLALSEATHADFARCLTTKPAAATFLGPRIKGLLASYAIEHTGPAPTTVKRDEAPVAAKPAKRTAPARKK